VTSALDSFRNPPTEVEPLLITGAKTIYGQSDVQGNIANFNNLQTDGPVTINTPNGSFSPPLTINMGNNQFGTAIQILPFPPTTNSVPSIGTIRGLGFLVVPGGLSSFSGGGVMMGFYNNNDGTCRLVVQTNSGPFTLAASIPFS
jgi:hypothetical protein